VEYFARYFRKMLAQGIYLAPSQFEAGFISTAHDESVVQRTIQAAKQAFLSESGD
jgi:glutamate-1-semialdehyde 2,1-aminomutase